MKYKKQYGITLKQAKIIAKKQLGRYPHCGCEIPVYSHVVRIWNESLSFKPHMSSNEEIIYLVNTSGKLSLRNWVNIEPIDSPYSRYPIFK